MSFPNPILLWFWCLCHPIAEYFTVFWKLSLSLSTDSVKESTNIGNMASIIIRNSPQCQSPLKFDLGLIRISPKSPPSPQFSNRVWFPLPHPHPLYSGNLLSLSRYTYMYMHMYIALIPFRIAVGIRCLRRRDSPIVARSRGTEQEEGSVTSGHKLFIISNFTSL